MNSSKYVMSQQEVRYKWNEIPWRKLEKSSFKLQKRIYRASKCNDIKKMHNLQRLLLKSMRARTLAVRKVTQDNRGKKTAGIDGKARLCELFSHKKEKLGQTSHRDAQSALNVTVYADDFVILHESEEIIFKAKTLTEEWLKTIRLELRSSKTKISHTLTSYKGQKPGFDFLGFAIRQYPIKCSKKGYKLLIKPSHKSIKQYKLAIKQKIRKMREAPQEGLVKELNPIIKGWSRYYTSVVSSKIFRSLDNAMNRKLWKWALYRHNNKGKCWIKRKYFKKYDNDNWRFMTNNNVILTRHSDNAIKRHTKVKGSKSPYDGNWVYWGSRISKVPGKSSQVIRMMKRQQGRCGYCNLWFRFDDFVHIHHQDRNRGNNNSKNLLLLHKHCHNQLHGSVHDKHQIREKPDDGKLSSPVLKLTITHKYKCLLHSS
ncbi:MAG: reverse transcriptase N-terminal domain-containing protein [Wolbachia pipientis]|nr:reverse transcriptase N-terminal domain-containing protein [Wolbachia pipientis]